MIAKQPRIHLTLTDLEATAGDIGPPHCFQLLNRILLAEVIQPIINFVQ